MAGRLFACRFGKFGIFLMVIFIMMVFMNMLWKWKQFVKVTKDVCLHH